MLWQACSRLVRGIGDDDGGPFELVEFHMLVIRSVPFSIPALMGKGRAMLGHEKQLRWGCTSIIMMAGRGYLRGLLAVGEG